MFITSTVLHVHSPASVAAPRAACRSAARRPPVQPLLFQRAWPVQLQQQQQQHCSTIITSSSRGSRRASASCRCSSSSNNSGGDGSSSSSDSSSDDDEDEALYEEGWDNDDEMRALHEETRQAAQQQAVAQLRADTLESAVAALGAAMVGAGLQGSIALGLGWLLLHTNLINSFRWDAHDVQTGLAWAVPVLVWGVLTSLLPLPPSYDLPLVPRPAAAAAAAGPDSSSSSMGDGQDDTRADLVWADLASQSVCNAIALSVAEDGTGMQEPPWVADMQPVTPLTPGSVLQTLRFMQEWETDAYSLTFPTPASWAALMTALAVDKLSSEVLYRGLVTAGLAAVLANTWSFLGTNPEGLFFYARLFNFLTPQSSLAVAAGLLVVLQLVALPRSDRDTGKALYVRLRSLDSCVVGRLTAEDWLVRVAPAEAAAAAAGSAAAAEAAGEQLLPQSADDGAPVRIPPGFGRMRPASSMAAADAAAAGAAGAGGNDFPGGSSSSSAGGGSVGSAAAPAAAGTSQQQQEIPSQLELDARLDALLPALQQLRSKVASSSSSSSQLTLQEVGAPSLTALEQEGAELMSQLLELWGDTRAAARARAAQNSSSSGSSSRVSGRAPSPRLMAALEQAARSLNSADPRRRLIIVHTSRPGGRSGAAEPASDDDDDDDDSSSTSLAARLAALEEEGEATDESSFDRRLQAWGRAARSSKGRGGGKAGRRRRPDDDSMPAPEGPQLSASEVRTLLERRAMNMLTWGDDLATKEAQEQPGASSSSSSSSSSADGEGARVQQAMRQVAAARMAQAGARRIAAALPTSQDRLARALLWGSRALTAAGIAGAWVTTNGNLAASAASSLGVQLSLYVFEEAVFLLERRRLQAAFGARWVSMLTMLDENLPLANMLMRSGLR